jgi:BirA family biotin operon repressor/biotin-[acetyl-CoA-carboxylase] ligase
LWTALRVVEETGSTNADVMAAARDGAAEGLVVVAEHQRAGRGRAGRSWSSPPRAGLIVSVLLRPAAATGRWPPAPPPTWGWLPLLAGVALAESVNRLAGVDASLKWPNDLLVSSERSSEASDAAGSSDERKCAGILAEVAGETVVVGIGLNVTFGTEELPPPGPGALPATSLALAGARTTDRGVLLAGLLSALERWYGGWRAHAGDADACGLRAAYRRASATLGRPVRAVLPDGTELTGTADTVDPDGRLVLRTGAGTRTLAAGDVIHLRSGPSHAVRPADCDGGGQALR